MCHSGLPAGNWARTSRDATADHHGWAHSRALEQPRGEGEPIAVWRILQERGHSLRARQLDIVRLECIAPPDNGAPALANCWSPPPAPNWETTPAPWMQACMQAALRAPLPDARAENRMVIVALPTSSARRRRLRCAQRRAHMQAHGAAAGGSPLAGHAVLNQRRRDPERSIEPMWTRACSERVPSPFRGDRARHGECIRPASPKPRLRAGRRIGTRVFIGKLPADLSTWIAVADELAATVKLVMGKLEPTPVAVIRGLEGILGEGTSAELVRKRTMDFFG